jgi:hypothetical protein
MVMVWVRLMECADHEPLPGRYEDVRPVWVQA